MHITYQNKLGSISVDIDAGKIRVMTFDVQDEWSREHNFGGNETWSAISGTLTKDELTQIQDLAKNISNQNYMEKPKEFHGFGMESLCVEGDSLRMNAYWNTGSKIPNDIRKCANFIKDLRLRGK